MGMYLCLTTVFELESVYGFILDSKLINLSLPNIDFISGD